MPTDCAWTEKECRRNLAVAQPLPEESEDLTFTRGQSDIVREGGLVGCISRDHGRGERQLGQSHGLLEIERPSRIPGRGKVALTQYTTSLQPNSIISAAVRREEPVPPFLAKCVNGAQETRGSLGLCRSQGEPAHVLQYVNRIPLIARPPEVDERDRHRVPILERFELR